MLHLTFGRNVSFALHSVYCAAKHAFIQQLVRLFDDTACCPFSREAQFCRKLLKLFALFLCVTARNTDVAASPRLPRMYGSHVMQVFSHHGHHRRWISMHGNVKPLLVYHLPSDRLHPQAYPNVLTLERLGHRGSETRRGQKGMLQLRLSGYLMSGTDLVLMFCSLVWCHIKSKLRVSSKQFFALSNKT